MIIKDYMPEIYINNKEMNNIIDSEQIEFETKLKKYIEDGFKDTFIKTATENGVAQYEQILGIQSGEENEDLDFRKKRVQSRLMNSVPFTENFLKDMLDNILGEGNWEYTLDYNNYTLTINCTRPGDDWYLELINFLKKTIPVNIDWQVVIYTVSWHQVRDGFESWQDVYDSDMTWQELMDGEWLE